MPDGGHRYRPEPRAWYRSPWIAALVVVGFIAVAGRGPRDPRVGHRHLHVLHVVQGHQAGRRGLEDVHARQGLVHRVPRPSRRRQRRQVAQPRVAQHLGRLPQRAAGRPARASAPATTTASSATRSTASPIESGDIRMPHQVHVDLRDLTCADCHDQVAHPKPGSSGTGVSMAVCTMCHNDRGRAERLQLLPHHAAVRPTSIPRTTSRRTARRRSPTRVVPALPSQQGGVLRPVPREAHARSLLRHWRYTHGPTATKDPLGCTGCHDEDTFCEQCHRVSHPADWEQTHGRSPPRSPAPVWSAIRRACATRCHEQRGVTP